MFIKKEGVRGVLLRGKMVKKIYFGVVGLLLIVGLISFGLAYDIVTYGTIKPEIIEPHSGKLYSKTFNYFNWTLDISESVLNNCKYNLSSEDYPVFVNCEDNSSYFGFDLPDGNYELIFYVNYNDSTPPYGTNRTNTAYVNFSIDTLTPGINIEYPLDGLYNYSPVEINYIYEEANVDKCWYEIEGTNQGFVNCGDSITGLLANEGWNNWAVYINDSLGRMNFSSSLFLVDTIMPGIVINSPIDGTNYSSQMNISNFSIDEANLNNCWVIINGMESPISCSNGSNEVYIENNEGWNNWAVYINDTVGHVNSSSVSFFVDSIFPLVSFDEGTAENGENRSQDYIYVNVSLFDANLDSVRYMLFNSTEGLINVSEFNSSVNELVWTSLPEGTYRYLVVVNDTVGNVNSTENRSITLDYTPPIVLLNSPLNDKALDSENVTLSYNVMDSYSVVECSLFFDGSLKDVQNVPVGAASFNVSGLSNGNHYWNISCVDSAGNIGNSGETRRFSKIVVPGFGNDTNFTNLTDVGDISAVYGFYIENINGSINWTGPLDLSRGFDWSQCISIKENNASADSLMCPEFDYPSRIKLNNLTWDNPRVLADGIICSSSICTDVSYTSPVNGSGGIKIFDVSGASAYTTEETPATIPLGGGGGGGGGSSNAGSCLSEWVCSEWSECIEGVQERNCELVNSKCTPLETKPSLTRNCRVLSLEEIEDETSGSLDDSEDGLQPGALSFITGAVIDTLGAASGAVLVIASFLLVIGGAYVGLKVRKNRAIKEVEELSAVGN